VRKLMSEELQGKLRRFRRLSLSAGYLRPKKQGILTRPQLMINIPLLAVGKLPSSRNVHNHRVRQTEVALSTL
jgi:hypothetical protein